MPRDDFDVITGPTTPSHPIPPASLPPAPNPEAAVIPVPAAPADDGGSAERRR